MMITAATPMIMAVISCNNDENYVVLAMTKIRAMMIILKLMMTFM